MSESSRHNMDSKVQVQAQTLPVASALGATDAPRRIESKDLFKQSREIEIVHEGRTYRLRVTQLNKLILTA